MLIKEIRHEKLTFKQRLIKRIKSHRKVTNKNVVIALIIAIGLLFLLNIMSPSYKAEIELGDAVLTASMAGDVLLDRFVEKVIDRYGHDYIFKYVQPYFHVSDYVTLNFEHPVLTRDTYIKPNKNISFKTSVQAVEALESNNITTVNLANNHMMDYQEIGLEDTIDAFEQSQIGYVGVGRDLHGAKKILYQEFNGIKIATLGFADYKNSSYFATPTKGGVLPANPSIYIPLIMEAREKADLVIVHLHWGIEYDNNPHPRQQDMARAMSDFGVDIIIGHHPHVLQPVEVYNNTLIFYSLGNFIFDQGWSRTRESVLVHYNLYADGTTVVEIIPLWIREAQPKPITNRINWYRRHKIFKHLSKRIGSETESYYQDNKLVIEVDHSHVVGRDE